MLHQIKKVKSGAKTLSPGDYASLRVDLSNCLYQDLIYAEITIKSPKKSLKGN